MKINRRAKVMQLICSTGLYGAERWILALMRSLDSEAVGSLLVNLVDVKGERSAVVQAARERGLEAVDLYTGGRFNPRAAWELAALADRCEVDLFHGHGFKSDLLGLLAARLSRRPMMTTPHGWSVEKDLKLRLYESLDRLSFRFMDMVCPLSQALHDDAARFVDRGRLRLIGNGVDLEEIRACPSPPPGRGGRYLIGYLGRMVKSKDLPTLLEALCLLLQAGRAVRLVLVGDGEQLPVLKAATVAAGLAGAVEFTGFRSETAPLLKSFDCFVLPSLSEGTPRCVMEAMGLGIPVVASDIPGNRLLVAHRETGLLFPVGDSRRLADGIALMMDQPDLARLMAQRGRELVEDRYSSLAMARAYQALYQEVLGPGKSAAQLQPAVPR